MITKNLLEYWPAFRAITKPLVTMSGSPEFLGAQHQRVGIVGFQHAGVIEDFIPDFPHGEPVFGCAGNFHG